MNLQNKLPKQSNRLLWLIVITLGICNAALIWQNLQMRSQLQPNEPERLKIGDEAKSFSAKNLDGQTVEIAFSENSKKRFFLFFTPTCKFCKQQFPEWKELILQAKNNGVEVYGIVRENEKTEEIGTYLDSFECGAKSQTPLQVLFVPSETLQNLKLNLTPTTVLLSDNGKIEQIWTGKWNEADKMLAFNSIKN